MPSRRDFEGLRRPLFYILLVLLLGIAVSLAGENLGGGTTNEEPRPEGEALLIESGSGEVRLTVELANTDAERSRGLMFRRELAEDAGMLFDFQTEQPVSFWMKNTFIPLDMFFIKSDGRIVKIAERTVPQSEQGIASPEPVQAVLETNAGFADRFEIEPGDTVRHPIFGNAP